MVIPLRQAIQDLLDIARHSRSWWELMKAALPIRWTGGLTILNDAALAQDAAIPSYDTPEEVAAALRKLKNRMKGEVIGDDGQVHYGGLAATDAYQLLMQTSQALRGIDPTTIEGDDARLAFWINLYNVLSIHGVAALGISRSVMEIPTFFHRIAYQIGPWAFTPDDIENGVLRRNGSHPATSRPAFPKDDPRLATCPSRVDARIHAALVCASTSCPPVSFYDAERIDQQLDMAAANYVATDVHIHQDKKEISLPITFLYYGDDFGGITGIPSFLIKHDPERKEAFEAAFAAGYRLTYQRYDWSLNGTL